MAARTAPAIEVDHWLALINPVTVLLGFLLTWGVVAVMRFKGTEITRAELNRQLTEWRQYAADRDAILKTVRDELLQVASEVQRGLARIRELDGDAMDLARDLRAEREFCRRCVAILRQHGLPVPPRE